MFGPEDAESAARGIIPRACVEILSAMIQRERTLKISSKLCVSYVEIFGDQIFDLLKGGAPCGQSKVAAQRYVLSGAAEQEVANLHDIEDVLSIGDKQKRFAATAMNERFVHFHFSLSYFIITRYAYRVHLDRHVHTLSLFCQLNRLNIAIVSLT